MMPGAGDLRSPVEAARRGALLFLAKLTRLLERGAPAASSGSAARAGSEDALGRNQAAYLAEAQKLSRTGSFGWNMATGQIFWSDETFRIYGYDPATAPTTGMVFRRIHPEDVETVRAFLNRAQQDRQDLDFEHRLLMPDGAVKHLHVVSRAMPDGSHFVGAVSDITARKEAYAALERSERRYRDVFDHMPIGLTQVDTSNLVPLIKELRGQGVTDLSAYIDAHPEFIRRATDAIVIEAANQHALRMFGAKNLAEMLGPSTRFWENSFDTARRMIEGRYRGEEFFQEETKMTAVDGRVFEAVFAAARRGALADKSLVGMIDITDRVRAQEMLNRVQADFAHAARVSMLGELTASIAHEVTQPLTAMATNAETSLRWLGRPQPDVAELRALAESIVADARRAADIVAGIRTLAARQEPEQSLVCFDEIIREALLFLRHEVQANAVAVAHDVAPGAPQVFGDRTQLQQVIVNLLVNSMQAMADAEWTKRRIAIRTVMSGDALRCTVEDSGPGIAPEHLDQLFASFFTTKEGGMGMGLPICRTIVEAHNGSITADNEGAEGGARFCVVLPAAAAPR